QWEEVKKLKEGTHTLSDEKIRVKVKKRFLGFRLPDAL
ncbi:unnamed protein product, partial [marine sediment metagenome]